MNVQCGNHKTAIDYDSYRDSRGGAYQHRQRRGAVAPARTQSRMQDQLDNAADYIRRREAGARGRHVTWKDD